ncbi:Putative centromere protein Scm3/HJURP [Colletotrichum destructivum]|uniref:Centromere protein Scm3/HJURP n=1 Tax=Colletotrichum destructivum TaxID=34406 RepID=A0AAX4IVX6_9PEZI|nr:Putative centromere protein Scm3/HJURP [Colletotrichum destructivum]
MNDMEPPAKRPRTGPSPSGQQSKEDEDDELNYEPEEVSQMRDPGYQLEQSRAFAAFKLKSTFEHIFQKYERDFTGIGDEIDLRTGRIIENNGHLERMRNERDTGIPDDDEDEEDEGVNLEDAFASSDEDDDEASAEDVADGDEDSDQSDDEEDEERILHDKNDSIAPSASLIPKAKEQLQHRSSLSHALSGTPKPGSEPRLSNLAPPRQLRNGSSNPSANVWGYEPESVDPTWRAPEISPPRPSDDLMSKLYGARYRFPVSQGSKSVWASRQDSELEKITPEPFRIDMAQLVRARQEASRMARPTSKKLLPAFTPHDDNEDDILGVSTVDRKVRPAGERNKEGMAKDQVSVTFTRGQSQEEPLPSIEVEQTRSKTATVSSIKETNGRSKTKSLVREKSPPETKKSIPKKERSASKKQLVPAKVRKPRKFSPPVEVFDEQVEGRPVNKTAGLDTAQIITSFVTDEEAQERPKQRIIVELFSKRPSADEITEVEDPEDMDVFALTEQDMTLASGLSGLTVSENGRSPERPVAQRALVGVSHDANALVEAPTEKAPEPPKNRFTRHQIDPSYAFSDDEDGIPTTRSRPNRSHKQSVDVPVTVKSAKPVSATAIEPSEEMLVSEGSEDQQGAEVQLEAEADNAESSPAGDKSITDEPAGMDVDDSEEQVSKQTAAPERHLDPDACRASEALADIDAAAMLQTMDDPIEECQPAGKHAVENPSLVDAGHLQSYPEVVADESRSLDPQSQEPATGKAFRQQAQDEPRIDVVQAESLDESEAKVEEGNSAEDIQQTDDEEVLEPFTIPLGLDKIDETSASEIDTGTEAMDIDLPNLPPPPTESPAPIGILFAAPRRSRPSSAIRSSRVGMSATSPMRNLNLQSSSPLRKYGNPSSFSSAKAHTVVRPCPSASPERKRNARKREPTAGQPSGFASESPHSGAVDVSATPAVGEPLPGPKPPRKRRQPKTPSTPSSRQTPLTAKVLSSNKRSIISLLSDNEDELTLDLFKTWTSSGGTHRDRKRTTSFTPVLLAGPETKITTPMKQRIVAASDGGDGTGSGTATTKGRKRKAAWAFATPTKVHFGSPSGSLIRTPGGNMRRCGEEGFRCDRDFCFTCL